MTESNRYFNNFSKSLSFSFESLIIWHISYVTKFNNIKTETNILGPGTYFKEKNKFEPKFKNVLHIKFPEKKNPEKEKSVYIENIINKNKEKKLGPGEYNIKTEYIKKEISNNKSFGSSVERFHGKEITPNKKSKKDSNINNNNVKNYINQFR